MKVLMTADTLGGVWSHAIELADALRREGVRTVLAALGRDPTDEQRREAASVPDLELRAGAFRLPWMEAPWGDVSLAGAWLLELAHEHGVDLAHLSEPVFASLRWDIPVVAVGHSCVLSWYRAVRGEEAPPEWDGYREAMRAGLAAADAVVAPSFAMLASLQHHYGVHGGTAVPNGRDAGRYEPATKEHFILTAGRLWDPAKNLAALAAVAPELAWPVHAAGQSRSPDGDRVEPQSVRLLGSLGPEAMAEALSRAAIYALPARYEPFGQSILEAALSGCALVLGDIASLRELWDGTAVFVGCDDVEALREALADLIAQPQRRQALATTARQRAQEYTPTRMARGYLEVYERMRSPACAS